MEVELRSQLERQERELLENRRKVQRNKRRNERKVGRSSTGRKTTITATSLADLEAVTTRAGFLRAQLALTSLTPLRRWYLELQLMRAEDKTQPTEGEETALQALETTLSRSQRCYDVVYREGVRVADAGDSLLDIAPGSVRELLSFSTRSDQLICRVTCTNDGNQTQFTSSHYVENLQTELDLLLRTQSHMDNVLAFLWKALRSNSL